MEGVCGSVGTADAVLCPCRGIQDGELVSGVLVGDIEASGELSRVNDHGWSAATPGAQKQIDGHLVVAFGAGESC